MRIRITISARYDSERIAKAIACSLEPDNRDVPHGLYITCIAEGKYLVCEIVDEGGLDRARSTADDMFRCLRPLEAIARNVKSSDL